MTSVEGRTASVPQERGRAGSGGLSPTDFARRFQEAGRLLWCIAAGVMNDRARVDDVLQEAAVVALGKLDQFDPAAPGTSFNAWAGQIVRFVALNESRKRSRENELKKSFADSGRVREAARQDHTTPTDARGGLHHDQAAFDDDIQQALGELDETARACLLMRTTLDLSYAEISRALDIPEGTAMSHVHRARQAMRKKLSDTRELHASPTSGTGGAP